MHTSTTPKRDSTAGDLANPLRASGTTKPSLLASAMEGRLRSKGFVVVEGMGAESIAALVKAMAMANKSMWGSGKVVRGCVESMSTTARDGVKEHPGLRVVSKLEDLPPGVAGEAACGHRVIRKLKSCSSVAKVAGSISKITRSATTGSTLPVGLILTDDSSTTINTAVKSIALTRTMLKNDNIDVTFTTYPTATTVHITVLPLPNCSLVTTDEFLYLPLDSLEKAAQSPNPSCGSSQGSTRGNDDETGSLGKSSCYTHDPYSWGDQEMPF